MTYDVIVVGGGIVGVATAWQLTVQGHGRVLVLEKENRLAGHQTSHNSGVIHSGIYYEPGSLKATLCREGARATKEFAREHGLRMRECGKLLVATNEREVAWLAALEERAHHNSIRAEVLDGAELRRREPNITGRGALFVAETAITDYVSIAATMARLISESGGEVRTDVTVTGVAEDAAKVVLHTDRGDVTGRRVIFCAGLQADRLARLSGLADDVRIVPFRGEYYDVVPARSGLVNTLVYPIPDPRLPFLGVHLTPTIDGGLNVGPNAVLGLAREGYRKGSLSWADFRDYAAFGGMWRVARSNLRVGLREIRNSVWKRSYLRECQKYCPDLRMEDLRPREAGIRAQAVLRDGTLVHDFLIRSSPRTLHVLNAPSPAATSAIPIARHLVDELGG